VPGGGGLRARWGLQDKFVSHTMKTEEEANIARIREEKNKADAGNPLEPLIASLLRGFVDDADLSTKLQGLYKVLNPPICLFITASNGIMRMYRVTKPAPSLT
jgi:hypothetical protein